MTLHVAENDLHEFAKEFLVNTYRSLNWGPEFHSYVSVDQVVASICSHCDNTEGQYLCSPSSLQLVMDDIAHLVRSGYMADLVASGIAQPVWDEEAEENVWVIDMEDNG